MKHQFSILFVVLFLIFSGTYFALGQQQIIFNKVLPPEGETFYHAVGITQSEDGYMWLATKRGLFRYDGYQILAYKHNPSDPNSLASDTLGSISIDATGKIWIGTL